MTDRPETWKTPNRRPEHGDVYRDRETGSMWLFIAEGQRDAKAYYRGKAATSELEWRFYCTVPDKRVGATRAHPADVPLPEQLDLVVNAGLEERLAELEGQVAKLEAERAALVQAMKVASAAVPVAVQNHLRKVYREARGRELTRGER